MVLYHAPPQFSLKGSDLPWGGILPLLLLSKPGSSYYLVYSIDQLMAY